MCRKHHQLYMRVSSSDNAAIYKNAFKTKNFKKMLAQSRMNKSESFSLNVNSGTNHSNSKLQTIGTIILIHLLQGFNLIIIR